MLAGVTPQWLRWMFGRIAPRYDLTNTIISAGLDDSWRWRLAQRAVGHPARHILDVACGTGGVLAQVARRCEPSAHLVGLDFTEAMLQVGRIRRSKQSVLPHFHFCTGDAQHLPFAEATFDLVTIMFGVRNFDQPAVGLQECYRVLRPGGYAYVVEFAWPQGKILSLLYGAYFRYMLPYIAWPLTGEWMAYRYLRDSVLAFRQGPDVATLLQQVGFVDVGVEPLSGGISALYEGRKPSCAIGDI